MSLAYGASTVFILLAILIFAILFFAAWLPLERGREILLRPLRSLSRIRRLSEEAAETGKTVHFSPGIGGLNGQAGTAETLNGLSTLSAVARNSARTRGKLVASANDSLTYLTTEDVNRLEYLRAGRERDYSVESSRFITQQDRIAYMAGLNAELSSQQVSGAIFLGRFGNEYLLAGHTLADRNISQVVGSSQVEALPLMLGTAGLDNVLLGEEVYAVPAYLDRESSKLASLQAQDWLRIGIIGLIILGTLAATLGVTIGDYFLR